jgi:NAD(P)-dependent dehydrogenase (short-subunit alcohol dehydrogenase family)
MKKLEGKVAVITGGNSGIGYASAEEFVKQGAQVIITGRNETAIKEAVENLGNGTTGIVADQANLQDTDRLVAEVKAKTGTVDILFINAGVASMAPIEQFTEEQFDYNMDVNFKGLFFTLQKFIPILNEGASVIFLSSVNAYTGMPNTSAYAASKAAVNSLARTASSELAPKKIRVNTINPGPVKTPIFSKMGMTDDAMEQLAGVISNSVPMKRFGEAAEIAKLVTFIASDDASFITGAEYNIDGGVGVNAILS